MRTIYLVNSYDDFEDKDTTHFTEGSLHILNNSAMVPTPKLDSTIFCLFPLSGIEFDSTDPDLAPRTATATFLHLISTNLSDFLLTRLWVTLYPSVNEKRIKDSYGT